MTDQGKPEDHHHDPQAPKFMRPQRPVLDEPLEEATLEGQEALEPNAPGLEREGNHEGQNLDATQEIKPTLELSRQPEQKTGEVKAPKTQAYSPYFPHGVYEDARAVEAYYGRGEVEVDDSSTPEKASIPVEPQPERKSRWLLVLFALLMIFVLLFLALTDRVPVAIF